MTTADIHALTGAYALDAIEEFERAAFERHLAECDSCAQEVSELRATAARLGAAVAEQPPPRLKARVMAGIAEVRQLPPVGPIPGPRNRRWPLRLTGVAAALLLVVSVSLGALLVRNQQQLDDERAQTKAVVALLSADDAKVLSRTGGTGVTGTVVVSRSLGQVMLMAANVPQAPSGKTYQVWLMEPDGTKPRSVGVMNPDSAGRMSTLDTALGSAGMFGVSIEAAGGSSTPTDVVMTMPLPA
ncbi:anti-sigma factor [Actinokineospora auranticolor]|uniref:Regulator of SigK n=1 Tax=Actinokineospora auranticolor TaxID=155976 RepID=A0A2S6GGK0_9PSEU|nr:anti-sigma factor [Actinokineospora auranticolor]PPK64333.1 anti-sigma-K factor RskA [Actinokineospora auranticolor]